MNQLPLSPRLLVPSLLALVFVGALLAIGKVPFSYNVRNLRVRWRMSLLTGQPLDASQDVGPIVCSCFGIGQHQISAEIKNGVASVDEVGRRLKAGTNCGACKPEIGKLLRGAAVRDSQPA